MFRSKMRCISLVSDEIVWMQTEVGEFVFLVLELGKFFSLEKLGWNEKISNLMLDPLSSLKSQVNSHL